jgi:hypothetical protein
LEIMSFHVMLLNVVVVNFVSDPIQTCAQK